MIESVKVVFCRCGGDFNVIGRNQQLLWVCSPLNLQQVYDFRLPSIRTLRSDSKHHTHRASCCRKFVLTNFTWLLRSSSRAISGKKQRISGILIEEFSTFVGWMIKDCNEFNIHNVWMKFSLDKSEKIWATIVFWNHLASRHTLSLPQNTCRREKVVFNHHAGISIWMKLNKHLKSKQQKKNSMILIFFSLVYLIWSDDEKKFKLRWKCEVKEEIQREVILRGDFFLIFECH